MRRVLTYQPAKPLWPAQAEALKLMRGREHFALFMAMRTGKSATVLADFGQLEREGKVGDLCVVAPAGVYKTWISAIGEHASFDLCRRMQIHVWKSGSKAEKKARDFLNHHGARCLLMNVEALQINDSPARRVLEEFVGQRYCYLAVDESTIIKNWKAKRTKYFVNVVRPLAKYRRILSGLATPRSPLDIYTQMAFLDPKIFRFKNYRSFENHYAIKRRQQFGGRTFEIIVGYREGTNEEIASIIKPHSYRVQFRPKVPPTWSIREVEMTPEQKKAYVEIKQFATTQISATAHVTAPAVVAQIMRMHQVLCGHVMDEEGGEHLIPENKTQALLEELEDYDGKAIIWFTYVQDLERCRFKLEEEYSAGGYVKRNGCTAAFYGGNESTREAEEQRFKTDPVCRFMLATAGAGGRGRTWSVADRVIYFSSSNDLEHREQSEQRSMGVEKDRGVDNVDLIVPGTVEEKILHALRAKINMAGTINGDTWKEWLV